MMKMVYQNIMVNTPDGKTVQHNWWANGHQMIRWVISLNLTSTAERGLGGHPPWGQASSPWCSSCRSRGQCTCFPKWGVWTDELTLLRTSLPHIDLSPQLLWPGCQWQLTVDGCLWIPLHRAWATSANPSGGHGGSWWGCSSVFSWEEAVGTSAFLVVMGQSMPWATNRDPLG